MTDDALGSFSIDISGPPPPGLPIRYRPNMSTLQEWIASSNSFRPSPRAIGNDWLVDDVAHYAAVWGAKRMLQECRHWVSREVDPPCAELMWQDIQGKLTP